MKNDVVLVMPKYSRVVRHSGLGYLAAALHNQEFIKKCQPHFTHRLKGAVSTEPFNVEVVDLSLAPTDFSLADHLAATKPLIVGTTAFTHNYKAALEIGLTAAHAAPEALRVIGGWEASPQAKKVLTESCFDLVVRNEGEETLVELATLTREVGKDAVGQFIPEIEGLSYRLPGSLAENQTHRPKLHLDEYPLLPEGFDLFKFSDYPEESMEEGKLAYLTGSRGCIFSCLYCANPAIYTSKIRYRSPANILAEVRELYARGYRHFSFRDEIFTADPKRARELIAGLTALQGEGIFIKWFCQTRADLLDEEMILAMKGSGLVKLIFGLESGDQAVVDYLKNSRVDLEKCAQNQTVAAANGIMTTNYYIFGGPRQTWQSMFRSFLYMRRNPPTLVGTQALADYPGNKTTGLTRPVIESEAALAKTFFDNCFFTGFIANRLSAVDGRLATILAMFDKIYSNAFRFAVMTDLYLRAVEDYSDQDRYPGFMRQADKYAAAGPIDKEDFLMYYFYLMALREKGELVDVQVDDRNFLDLNSADLLKRLEKPITALLRLGELGVHPKVADAYFDQFLAEVSLARVERTLLRFSIKNLTKFYLAMSILWEIARESGLKPPSLVEFDVDRSENGPLMEQLFNQLNMRAYTDLLNDSFPEGLPAGPVTINLLGLPVVMDVESGKITLKVSAYQPSDKITLDRP